MFFSGTELKDKDVIITATDGVFDNLFRQDFEDIFDQLRKASDLNTESIAQHVLNQAVRRAHGQEETPFSKRCNRLGFDLPPRGKIDDITIVTSIVSKVN